MDDIRILDVTSLAELVQSVAKTIQGDQRESCPNGSMNFVCHAMPIEEEVTYSTDNTDTECSSQLHRFSYDLGRGKLAGSNSSDHKRDT